VTHPYMLYIPAVSWNGALWVA